MVRNHRMKRKVRLRGKNNALSTCCCRESGRDTLIIREASKEAPKQYNLRGNARIWSHPYKVNNMLISTKKLKNISLKDVYISKDFENMKRSKPMKMGVPPLNTHNP